ncbi:MAG: molybdopterin molybdotransferase MoeA [Armatimonadota bacterium]|nr:molybdopterin molybdotransferase MoeA [Armatimonadota bacterium]MDR7427171.1 molybdopterin molybdotransferase MoeA [Armatimonadota bacterium]MDR7473546.1 molybdopterin molybdotransferase MoeA [Armatimonadota bacterium]
MRAFRTLALPSEARDRYLAVLAPAPLGTETVPLEEALDRILAADLVAGEDLPPFDRSTVDGFAVRAADTAGAGEAAPVRLRLSGEVHMGQAAGAQVRPGEAVRVPTGGMLPPGADAVVMQEDVRADGATLEVRRALRPGENVLPRGEDVPAGSVVLRAGRRLRPQDLGILAGLGHSRVLVRRRPTVAIASSGDEVVPPDRSPRLGQVRDMNTYTLGGLVQRAGGVPVRFPILPDDLSAVESWLRTAVEAHDVVLISGGSSVGERDVVPEAIRALGPPGIVVRGVAIRPGKPTVLAVAGTRPVIGLPGNPVSAMVIFDVFVRPVLARLLGLAEDPRPGVRIRARAARALVAPAEREEHARVALEARGEDLWAHPLPAQSGLLTSMVRADGIVIVPAGARVDVGEPVEVELLED